MRKILLASGLLFTTITNAQNVGIGIAIPLAPLHIKSPTTAEALRLDGVGPYISFFKDGTYGGYLWLAYNGQMQVGTPSGSAASVVISSDGKEAAYFTSKGLTGLGVASPTERLDVNGNVNISGVLKMAGSSGNTGQVLTSNGSSAPAWRNMPYNNTTRFAVTNSSSGGSAFAYTTTYNLDPASITTSSTGVTINKTGLYHIESHMYTRSRFDVAEPELQNSDHFIYINSTRYDIETNNPGRLVRHSWFDYNLSSNFSMDIYITAPSTVTITGLTNFSAGPATYVSRSASGRLSGYLISE